MIVVSDTTPLIMLMKISKLELLHDLFGEVLIPEAVLHETTRNVSFQNEAELIKNSSYVKVVSVTDRDRIKLIQRVTGLDLGETEAIVYADETKADVLLIDESKGRQVALNMNLPISGSMGVLIGALEKNLISLEETENAVNVLRKSNIRISEQLFQSVLHKAYETLSLRLLNTRDRPFIVYQSGTVEVTALIDTGALTPVYIIPVFELADNHSVYRINNLQVAVCRHPEIGCDFVLSDTMFSKTDTLISRRKEKRMNIIFDKSEYYCTPRYDGNRFTVVTWAQDNSIKNMEGKIRKC